MPGATGTEKPELTYIGVSRLHRNRANLIQTLHTVSALENQGVRVNLFFPPWGKSLNVKNRLAEFSIFNELNLKPSHLLHSNWQPLGVNLFSILTKFSKYNKNIFVRSARISSALCRFNIKHSLEVHDALDILGNPQQKMLIEQNQKGLIRNFIAISESARNILVDNGAVPHTVSVVPCGANIKEFADLPPFDPRRLEFPRVVYIGRVSRSRGLDVLNFLAEQGIVDIELVGDVEGTFNSKLSVRPFVPHARVPGLYGEADLVLLPYQKDLNHVNSISPLKLFEALAAGRPIIASDLPPIREIIEDGKTGLLVEPDVPEKWADAIKKIRSDRSLAVKLAAAAKEKAKQFSWECRAKKLIGILGLK
jgi:glycosyltransferase involved in cell wall biosynthesis